MSQHIFTGAKQRSFWSALARRADAPEAGDIYRGIERQLREAPGPSTGVWAALADRVDPAKYCPTAVPDVAEDVIVEDGEERAVICSPRRNYLVLDPMRRELWHMMDGTRPIGQLAMHAFTRYHKLMDVAEFVGILKTEGFLTEHPVGVYHAIATRLEERSVEGWGQRLLHTLTNVRFTFRDIDPPYRFVYRYGARFLFSPVFLLMWGLLVLGGLAAFAGLFWQGSERQYDVLSLSGSVPLGLVALWAILFVSFVLHESAHALAVKHFGRQLHGGGVMLYYGMPAAFVDTSDIWRAPRRARMIVSAAGPMSDLLVGSLAALVAYAAAANPALNAAGALSFKLAVACYVAVLFNANPLLELDGYFILMDWLRIPNLRARALTYIRGPLWAALRAP
jgi:putative peptide zinc metalloprotease protein